MASGYEKSPDYGGAELTRWGTRVIILVMLLAIALLAWLFTANAAEAKDEKHWQGLYCAHKELEHVLPSGGRIDCLDDQYAIEVDYADKWAESVGQSLYYAHETGRTPGIILLCPSSDTHAEGLCRSYTYRLFDALALVGRPVMVWMCFLDTDKILGDCIQPHP